MKQIRAICDHCHNHSALIKSEPLSTTRARPRPSPPSPDTPTKSGPTLSRPIMRAAWPPISAPLWYRLVQASRPSRPTTGPCDFEPARCVPFASPLFVSPNNADTLARRTLALTLCDGSPPKPIFWVELKTFRQNRRTLQSRLSATGQGVPGCANIVSATRLVQFCRDGTLPDS
jgi:hypothetical protein